ALVPTLIAITLSRTSDAPWYRPLDGHAAKRSFESREAFENFVQRYYERWSDSNDVGTRDEHDKPGVAGGLQHIHRAATPWLVQFATEPHAFAAQVTKDTPPRVDRFQSFHEERVPCLEAVEHFGRV